MLEVLRRIIQEVNAAVDLSDALEIIVSRVKGAMEVDVCSVYLTDLDHNQYVLMATDGLNAASVGQVRIDFSNGLVGMVAEREEPLNIQSAKNHPRYQYFPETGEEQYSTFLGVPVIHHREVMGVVVVQRHAVERFDEDEVAFLVTIGAQLSGAIAHAQASGGIDGLRKRRRLSDERPILGVSGAPGVAIGTAVVRYPHADLSAVPDRRADDPEAEELAFRAAVTAVRVDIETIVERMRPVLPAEDSALFDAFIMMLDGDSLVEKSVERIRDGNWAPGALRNTVDEHVNIFEEMDDPYLRERAQDVRDLGRRILQYLQEGDTTRIDYPADTVLVGEEITASMLAEVPTERLTGIVSVSGSRTSHVAILARALGVPVVMGADDLPVTRVDGAEIIADGYSGRIYVNPGPMVVQEFERLVREEDELSDGLKALRDLPAESPDGVRIPLYANTGLLSDIGPSLNSGAEGVGLYRTEFPFMIRERFPSEQEQYEIYREVLESFAPRPVTLRTLDVGGDKALPYFPIEEDNPFLGWRGIRITLDHPEIFLVQLRAMLRASAGLDNLNLLLPMISSVDELDDSIDLIDRAYNELIEEGVAVKRPKIGAMVEVPSAVYQADVLAKRVDFLSVGTNDLTQYLLAVDRNNARVADLYDSLHPAVLRAMMQIVEGARRFGKPVSVCGEMAGDPASALLLLGMGVDSLSMSTGSLARVKWVIRTIDAEKARSLLQEALLLERSSEIREQINTVLEREGLGGLVRAGK
ncbi:phosphoenolpyruvate--protein phosphotransferase [Solemya pervernicosa gill symbiont]|uniref:phosphoenolpyruvate--protein phosphotransferase n=2 Tax=Gammaproteobacteria incertae sedis TaxID=118884 RepID=A0A1T2L0S2_9GAMM|nr:phosphoenolpyruvate--protein phosphotransferase [Candidatus Reidiella endopervernicosa]OOZ38556.1 phosphoenolpyruvate--protein phosphotransferase [Solemya pervernicosa gill symbiont]QKQ27656.1 phosphoenolpyruvate--protein phosphotransferase [Candidatus Reidiella endopervernicosa]